MNYYIMKNKSKGQSLVETALILPVIILLLSGIIDFGLFFNSYLIVNNAAREGARLAVTGSSDANVINEIRSMVSSLDSSKISISVAPDEAIRSEGDEVIVTVGYDYNLITPLINSIFSDAIHINAKTIMRME